jgi:hypothetical protein
VSKAPLLAQEFDPNATNPRIEQAQAFAEAELHNLCAL